MMYLWVKEMISVVISGGLGNQLFQYAAGYALSKRYNLPLTLDTNFYPHQDKLVPKNVDRTRKFILNRFNVKYNGIRNRSGRILYYRTFKNRPINLNFKSKVQLRGHWMNLIHFQDSKDDLAKMFTPTVPVANKTLDEILRTKSVSLHVRRGDAAKMKKYKGICDVDYYQDQMAEMRSLLGNPRFFVFSDDIAWVKGNIIADDITYVQGYDQVIDFHMMSRCDHNIIANSTFSWWAAYINKNDDKVVKYPRKWTNRNTKSEYDALIPEDWK